MFAEHARHKGLRLIHLQRQERRNDNAVATQGIVLPRKVLPLEGAFDLPSRSIAANKREDQLVGSIGQRRQGHCLARRGHRKCAFALGQNARLPELPDRDAPGLVLRRRSEHQQSQPIERRKIAEPQFQPVCLLQPISRFHIHPRRPRPGFVSCAATPTVIDASSKQMAK